MPLGPGARLGPYEVVAAIGAGGMGEVYRARDSRLGRDVAIKVLPATLSSDPDRLARFEQEARAAAALNHPNILAVFDIGTHLGSPYIVSELLEGGTLREQIGSLTVRKTIDYAIQLAHGLAAAHEKGIAHRDLKPENVFVTTEGHLKILDFGLAKLTQAESSFGGMTSLPTTPAVHAAAPQTIAGVVLGTVGYMAPEQVRGLAADHRSDIFALGAVVYEMLSGTRAFHGDTTMDTMMAIAKESPAELPVAARSIPPALARIVDRCLEKNPAARFQSTRDLAFALESVTTASSAASAPLRVRSTFAANSTVAWSVAGLALAAAIGIGMRSVIAPAPAQRGQSSIVRFTIPLAGTDYVDTTFPPDISRDGREVVYSAVSNGKSLLYLRAITSWPKAPTWGVTSPPVTWVDRQGAIEPLALPAREYSGVELSPDGQSLAVYTEGGVDTIWLADLDRLTLAPLATGSGSSQGVVWSPNGKRIAYRGTRRGLRNIFSTPVDGSAAETRITTREDTVQNPGRVHQRRQVDGIPAEFARDRG